MARPPRIDEGGLVYHALNRAIARMPIFDEPSGYETFERVLEEATERVSMRVLAYCVIPNHWHLVLWPREDGDLSKFMAWLTLTHTRRWHAYRHSTGRGHVYQGRFKSFVIQSDECLLTVCRYVEQNALRANLVEQAEQWQFSSLWRRTAGDAAAKSLLSDWPVERPRNWRWRVNQALTPGQLEALRRCVNRGRPFGSDPWVKRTASRLGLESTLRSQGRPKKKNGS